MTYIINNKRTKWPFFVYTRGQLCYYICGNVMTLKEIRKQNNLTQLDASTIVGVPVRTYRRYETDDKYGDILKRKIFINLLTEHCLITEERGLQTIEKIKEIVTELFENEYKGEIEFCYLFGSYAKGTAKETSDIDLYVSSTLTGLKFVGLIERLRQSLHKKVDLLRSSELINNIDLLNEIMKEGIKIYG